jgi:DNA-binding transcriptional regulator YiaG
MTPGQFKEIRGTLGLRQQELAEILGVSDQMVVGHYETGFRRPGKLIQIVMSILGSLPEKRREEFIKLLKAHGKRIEAPIRGGKRG